LRRIDYCSLDHGACFRAGSFYIVQLLSQEKKRIPPSRAIIPKRVTRFPNTDDSFDFRLFHPKNIPTIRKTKYKIIRRVNGKEPIPTLLKESMSQSNKGAATIKIIERVVFLYVSMTYIISETNGDNPVDYRWYNSGAYISNAFNKF
jgi:hypothetical protein